MRSFVFWHDNQKNNENILSKEGQDTQAEKKVVSKKNDEKTSDVEIHVNLWKLKEQYIFDLGFFVFDITDISNLYLYVPFKISEPDISDLGKLISNNTLITSIFNDNYTTKDGSPKRIFVDHKDSSKKKSKFVVYALDIKKQVGFIETSSNGTLIKIDISNIIEQSEGYKSHYFRLRVTVDKDRVYLINNKAKLLNPINNFYQTTEIIDFRINDVRTCDDSIREEFAKNTAPNISAVHYLILRDIGDIIINYDLPLSSRVLEHNIWKPYLNGIPDDLIAYHIKSKAENDCALEKFSYSVRFQYKKNTVKSWFGYIIVFVILSFAASIGINAFNWLFSEIGNMCKTIYNIIFGGF